MLVKEASDPKLIRIGSDGRTFIPAWRVRNPLEVQETSRDETPTRLAEPTAVKINVQTPLTSFSSYHLYNGGREFRPVLPRSRLLPGASVMISLERLPLSSFVTRIPLFELVNRDLTKWVSDKTIIQSLRLEGDILKIVINQEGPFAEFESFELSAKVDKYPGRSNQRGGVYLECHMTDYIGRKFAIRIRHDGLRQPQFQINRGAGFEVVTLISYDGLRISFRYGVHGTTSTCYLSKPSDLVYDLDSPTHYSGPYLDMVKGMYTGALIVASVKFRRRLERMMFQRGSSYDQGRIGSEIAYVCGEKFLGLRNLVLEEPSKGGKDLFTLVHRVAIQARLLKNRPSKKLKDAIQIELLSLTRKLGHDFRYNPEMRTGYAILSFIEAGSTLKTLLLKVPNPRNWELYSR
jgi:hypothetical protein